MSAIDPEELSNDDLQATFEDLGIAQRSIKAVAESRGIVLRESVGTIALQQGNEGMSKLDVNPRWGILKAARTIGLREKDVAAATGASVRTVRRWNRTGPASERQNDLNDCIDRLGIVLHYCINDLRVEPSLVPGFLRENTYTDPGSGNKTKLLECLQYDGGAHNVVAIANQSFPALYKQMTRREAVVSELRLFVSRLL
jgi:hypothetical protein